MRINYIIYIAVSVIVFLFSMGNYYVFCRMNTWFSFGFSWKFNLFGALLGFCSFTLILWQFHSINFVYHVATYWFGLIFIAFKVFFISDIFSKIFPIIKPSNLAYLALFIIFVLAVHSVHNNLTNREVKSIQLLSSKIKTPIKIVLIADTHINRYHSADYLQRLVSEINQQKPDIVAIAGDFADGKTEFSTIKPINDIKAPVYLVMGNHEIWNNHNGVIDKILSRTKITVVHKRKLTHKGVQIVGVHYANGQYTLEKELKEINLDIREYNILLYHEPKEVEVAQAAGIDLMLSGHTHAGQIFPWNYVTRLAYKYIKGLHEYKGMKIYVSQGTSIWGPPMRLGSTNEITVIDLRPEIMAEKWT